MLQGTSFAQKPALGCFIFKLGIDLYMGVVTLSTEFCLGRWEFCRVGCTIGQFFCNMLLNEIQVSEQMGTPRDTG